MFGNQNNQAQNVGFGVGGMPTQEMQIKEAMSSLPQSLPQEQSSMSVLAGLAQQAAAFTEAEEQKEKRSFLTLVKNTSKCLDPNSDTFIQGAKPLDFVISKDRLNLGSLVDVTILGMFKVYAEVEPAPKRNGQKIGMDRTVGFVPPVQAESYPLVAGSYFDRELPNGHVLQPNNWVVCYLHDFPEVKNAIVSFKSVGNRFFSELQKFVKANSRSCTELRFALQTQTYENKTYGKTDYYPLFKHVGYNYKFENGQVVLDKMAVDCGLTTNQLEDILTKSNELQKAYQETKLVSPKQFDVVEMPTQAISAPAYQAQDASYDEGVQF